MTTFYYTLIGIGLWMVVGYACTLTMFIKCMHHMNLRFSGLGWWRQFRFLFLVVNPANLVKMTLWPFLLLCMSDYVELVAGKMILQMRIDATRKGIYCAQAFVSGGDIVLLADSGLAWTWDAVDGWTPRIAIADEDERSSESEIIVHSKLPRLRGWNTASEDRARAEAAHA